MTRTPNPSPPATTYAQSGVDIDAGNALVEAIKPLAKASHRIGTDADLGGFGGLFDLKRAGFKDPILVSTTDGVGTKLKIAIDTGHHTTIGIDLVAMCVNDLVVAGAEPLFFLDYFATGKLDVAVAKDVIAGIATGCREANCALIGGETAEMPGLYHGRDYDLAGFSVGAVERGEILPRADIEVEDVLIGLASSGVHANGFALVRRLVADAGLGWDAPAPFAPDKTLAAALLEPTRIYVSAILSVLRATGGGRGAVKALAHITGGGLSENLPRVLPSELAAAIDLSSWTPPAVFGWLAAQGHIPDAEMLRTFNCGIGMVIVVAKAQAQEVMAALTTAGETPLIIGSVVAGSGERSNAKGKGEAWAVQYSGRLGFTV